MIYPLKYRFWRINLLLDLILALPTRRFLIMEITKNSIIGDVLDKYPETAEAFFSIGMPALVALHQEAKQLKRHVWFTVQMPTSLLMFSTGL